MGNRFQKVMQGKPNSEKLSIIRKKFEERWSKHPPHQPEWFLELFDLKMNGHAYTGDHSFFRACLYAGVSVVKPLQAA